MRDPVSITAGVLHVKETTGCGAEGKHFVRHQPFIGIRTLIDAERHVGDGIHQRLRVAYPCIVSRVRDIHAVGDQNQRVNALRGDCLQLIDLFVKGIRDMTRCDHRQRLAVGMCFGKLGTPFYHRFRQ